MISRKYKAQILVRFDQDNNVIDIAPALNPDGSRADVPPGFSWVDCECQDWTLDDVADA